MSLQRRLTLFFVLIVVLPLVAAGVVVQRVVVNEVARRSVLALRPALDSSVLLYNNRVQLLDEPVRAAVSRPAFSRLVQHGSTHAIQTYLDGILRQTDGIDFLILEDDAGAVVASSQKQGAFVAGFAPPTAAQILDANREAGPGFDRTGPIELQIPGQRSAGKVIGGFWIDRNLLGDPQESVELSVLSGKRVIASTLPLPGPRTIDVQFGDTFDLDLNGSATAEARKLTGSDMSIVASTPTDPIKALSRRVLISMLGLLALALFGTTLLAYLLARLITQPLEELSEGAAAIAEGRFDHQIPVRSRDEVGQLATAFNHMTERLESTVKQLSSSRDQLQRAVHRVGETLRSTHDMDQILESIIKTASDAVQADAAVLWRFTPTRDALYAAKTAGIEEEELSRLQVGEGVVGFVAERAVNVMVPGDGTPHPALGEPAFRVGIVTPLYSQDRIVGVLGLYRSDPQNVFSGEDLDTVVFLAEQGGVAIENVLLHEEAQRLSLTDGLTGVWNRRYYQMQFRQVLATATRFHRPFSVLMLDLDHFKEINDTYGHQRGDAILIEFSQRVSMTLREIDTFARYGGEEFICLLSETDLAGAATTADKILYGIRSETFGGAGEDPVRLTVSIGVAAYPDHGDSFRSLVAAADKALYTAKENGRDRVAVATPVTGLRVAT